MEAYNLTHSLLLGLKEDCISAYPDDKSNIDFSFQILENQLKSIDGIADVCLIGKCLETSLIADQAFFPASLLCSRLDRNLPSFFNFLWIRIFSCADRRPLIRYLDFETVVIRDQSDLSDVKDMSIPDEWYTWCTSSKGLHTEVSSTATAVFFARQILLLLSKAEDLPVIANEEEELSAFKKRVTEERDIKLPRGLIHIARRDLRSLLEDDGYPSASLTQWIENPFGKHGPGAVFDGSGYKEKWQQGSYYGQYSLINRTNHSYLPSDASEGRSINRLSIVPKDFRKHRLICIEQKEVMFAQQGFRAVLESLISRDYCYSSIMSTVDQHRNFARSRYFNKISTIDLSDASDHVSIQLIKLLFPAWFTRILLRLRASSIELPDGEVIESYNTLYTMGNALCFPIETLVFSSLVSACLQYYFGLSRLESTRHVSVFGDDIVVTSKYYDRVIGVLVDSGFSPNLGKCCHSTPARESCGSWYYGSYDIRISKIKCTSVHTDRDWVASLQIAINLSNNGLNSTAMRLLSALDNYYPVPYGFWGLPQNPLGNIHVPSKRNTVLRYNSQLQRMEFFCPTSRCQKTSRLSGDIGLYAYFTNQSSNVMSDSPETVRQWNLLD